MTGTIKRIHEKGFGFISVVNGPDIFFHATTLQGGLEFDDRLTGQRVEFDTIDGDRGPRATFVKPAK